MTVTATVSTPVSGNISGFGYFAVATVVMDSSYPTGGEAVDLSAIFPNQVYGGVVIADTLNDGGFKASYVLAAAGAPATGIIQCYWVDTTTDGAAMAEVADMTSLAAVDGQTWLFCGR